MRRKGREPEQQATKFGGEQLDTWYCEKKIPEVGKIRIIKE